MVLLKEFVLRCVDLSPAMREEVSKSAPTPARKRGRDEELNPSPASAVANF